MKNNALLLSAMISLLSVNTMAYEAGDIIFRAGLTTVSPDDSSSNITVGGNDIGTEVTVDDDTQLGLNIAYFLYDKVAIELLAATPFTHDLKLSDGTPLGETTQLPPTLSLNYYFANSDAAFQPYIGAGLNYTLFFDEEFTSAMKDNGFSDLDLDASVGLSAQLGMDYKINGNYHINGSIRWIDIDTDASFDLAGDIGRVSVSIDPWVYTLSVGYVF